MTADSRHGLTVNRFFPRIPRPFRHKQDQAYHSTLGLVRYTLLYIGYQNIFRTRSIPATNASTSSLVLYKAKEARTVPSTPIRRIRGSAQ